MAIDVRPLQFPDDLDAFPEFRRLLAHSGITALHGPAFLASRDDVPIAAGGVTLRGGGGGQIWAIFGAVNGDGFHLVRIIHRMMLELMDTHQLLRLEALVHPDRPLNVRLVQALGFTCETPGHMGAYWMGEPRDMWSLVRRRA